MGKYEAVTATIYHQDFEEPVVVSTMGDFEDTLDTLVGEEIEVTMSAGPLKGMGSYEVANDGSLFNTDKQETVILTEMGFKYQLELKQYINYTAGKNEPYYVIQEYDSGEELTDHIDDADAAFKKLATMLKEKPEKYFADTVKTKANVAKWSNESKSDSEMSL